MQSIMYAHCKFIVITMHVQVVIDGLGHAHSCLFQRRHVGPIMLTITFFTYHMKSTFIGKHGLVVASNDILWSVREAQSQ